MKIGVKNNRFGSNTYSGSIALERFFARYIARARGNDLRTILRCLYKSCFGDIFLLFGHRNKSKLDIACHGSSLRKQKLAVVYTNSKNPSVQHAQAWLQGN